MGLFFNKKKKTGIYSPVNNTVVKELATLDDGVFSEKMLGNGAALPLSDGKVYAPISGKVVTAFPTGHAYGIENSDGLNVLVHIGIDTVNLQGKGFKAFVNQNQEVKQGDLLAEVDLSILKKNNVISDVVCIVTSDSKVQINEKNIKFGNNVSKNDVIIDL